MRKVAVDPELELQRRRIDELSTKMLFDKEILDKNKLADATKLIADIIYPLQIS